MTRRLLNLVTLLSLLLCVAVVVLWVRSYWAYDSLRWEWNNFHDLGQEPQPFRYRTKSVLVAHGGVQLGYEASEQSEWVGGMRDPPGFRHISGDPLGEYPVLPSGAYFLAGCWLDWTARGFQVRASDTRDRWEMHSERSATVPMWLPTLLTAAAPACWARTAWRRRRFARHGYCPRCGYDLRATPGQCPECGSTGSATTSGGRPGS